MIFCCSAKQISYHVLCNYRLCKLLTNPITEVKDLAADLLFVLCKESGKISVVKTLQLAAQHYYIICQ